MKTWKVNLKHLSNIEYQYLREICHLSKNVYNESVYNIRQHYFSEGTYLQYESNYYQMKTSENYMLLGANVAQQTMKSADQSFKSFFALRKKSKQGTYESWKVKLPGYLPKDGFHLVVFTQLMSEASANGEFTVPISFELRKKYTGLSRKFKLKVPTYIQGKKIHQIQIIPKYHGRYFEARFLFDDFEIETTELDSSKALAIDLGVNNFATCATSTGKSFIIDGRKIKSINQWYNKENARLSSIKDLQGIDGCTKRQYLLARKRNRRIDDFIYKSTKYIISYCTNNHIGNLVVGYNDGFQDKVDMGKVNNQKFAMLPYGKFKDRLQYLCKQYGINYKEQEESYTSKANFFGKDDIPTWNPLNPKQGNFSGKRIERGLYKTNDEKLINADVNGALNILRKSKVVSLQTLYNRGTVLVPMRIRLT